MRKFTYIYTNGAETHLDQIALDIPAMRQAGMSTVAVGFWNFDAPTKASITQILDVADANGMKVWLSLHNWLHGSFIVYGNMFENTIVDIVTYWKDHPALGGWYTDDEGNYQYLSWSTTATFGSSTGVYCTRYNNKIYKSLQATNLNHNPETSPTWWQYVRDSSSTLYAYPQYAYPKELREYVYTLIKGIDSNPNHVVVEVLFQWEPALYSINAHDFFGIDMYPFRKNVMDSASDIANPLAYFNSYMNTHVTQTPYKDDPGFFYIIQATGFPYATAADIVEPPAGGLAAMWDSLKSNGYDAGLGLYTWYSYADPLIERGCKDNAPLLAQMSALAELVMDAPSPPINLFVEVDSFTQITLTWDAPLDLGSNSDQVTYNIYRNNTLVASAIELTEYTATNVSNVAATWSVTATNFAGLSSTKATSGLIELPYFTAAFTEIGSKLGGTSNLIDYIHLQQSADNYGQIFQTVIFQPENDYLNHEPNLEPGDWAIQIPTLAPGENIFTVTAWRGTESIQQIIRYTYIPVISYATDVIEVKSYIQTSNGILHQPFRMLVDGTLREFKAYLGVGGGTGVLTGVSSVGSVGTMAGWPIGGTGVLSGVSSVGSVGTIIGADGAITPYPAITLVGVAPGNPLSSQTYTAPVGKYITSTRVEKTTNDGGYYHQVMFYNSSNVLIASPDTGRIFPSSTLVSAPASCTNFKLQVSSYGGTSVASSDFRVTGIYLADI